MVEPEIPMIQRVTVVIVAEEREARYRHLRQVQIRHLLPHFPHTDILRKRVESLAEEDVVVKLVLLT